MKNIILTLAEAEELRAAASMAAEFARENAEAHERYCEDKYAVEERADERRFEDLAARLHSLIEIATASGAATSHPVETDR